MKKKLLLFITYLFLFSTLTIFLGHCNLQLSRKKEVKILLKEKSNLNQEEKPEENSNQEEEELPWTFTWKGAIISLIPSIVIGASLTIRYFNYSILTIVLLYNFVFPGIFAIQKYKDKSYGERFCIINRSFVKNFFNVVILVLLTIGVYGIEYR